MQRLLRLYFYDIRPTFNELAIGNFAIIWGVTILLPEVAFTQVSAYRFLLAIAPEMVWGLLLLAIGVIQAYLSSTAYTKARLYVAYLAVVVWLFLTMLSLVNNVYGAGWIFHALLLCLALWVAARLTVERGISAA